MKKVFNNQELTHIYAKQSQVEGRTPNGSMYFIKEKIYSYNDSWCVANIIDPGKTVLFNSGTYSVTTTQHTSLVKIALSHYPNSYSVPYPHSPYSVDNLTWCKSEFDIYLKKHLRATKYSYVLELKNCIDTHKYLMDNSFENRPVNFKDIHKQMVTALNILHNNPEKLKQALRDEDKLRKLNEKIENERRVAVNQTKIKNWQKEKLHTHELPYLSNAYLRITSDYKFLETSQNVFVPLWQARKLWLLIKAGQDIVGYNIDGNKVISINGTLKVGCHNIPIEEVNRIGKIFDSMKTPRIKALNKQMDLID